MSVSVQVSTIINRLVADVFRFYSHEHVHNHPITIYAEFADLDESQESWITGLVERSVRNIKKIIESKIKG